MSKHTIAAGDAPKLLALLARLRGRAEQLVGGSLNVKVIQEAGLDGFWVHRWLEGAKTDAIDGETLLRTFLAWKRGEPRVCEMVVPPTPEQRGPPASLT
jgi:transposase